MFDYPNELNINLEVKHDQLYQHNCNTSKKKLRWFSVDYKHVPSSTVKKYVIQGYPAPYMPRLFYLKTLWTLDNETINVWTHLISAIYFVSLLYKYSLEMNIISNWPVLVIITSSLVVTLCSSFAHLFHSRSEIDHCCWMLLDFFGIVMFSYGSTVVHFFACSELSYYLKFGYWNLAILTFNCCFAYMFLCLTKVPSKVSSRTGYIVRVAVLAYGYIYGIVPIFNRLYMTGWTDTALRYHVLSILLMTVSPLLYITDKPQCFCPGLFDLIGHNHQWFHIVSSFAFYFDIFAVHSDVMSLNGHWKILKNQINHPSLIDIIWFAFFIFLWCFALFCYTVYNVRNHHVKKC